MRIDSSASPDAIGGLFIAPVAGYTDRQFRSLCAEQGAAMGFTELASTEAISRNFNREPREQNKTELASYNILRRGNKEKRYCIQLFGANPDVFYQTVLLLRPFAPDGIDINAGCPVPKVVKNGAGSALMKDPQRLSAIVSACVAASKEALGSVPVSVKIRSGWDAETLNYIEVAEAAIKAGVSMVSLHPRTRSQGYSGKSDWSCIKHLVQELGGASVVSTSSTTGGASVVEPVETTVRVCGSGDLYTPEDARRMFEETDCNAIMFARGAMGNPFIFRDTIDLLTKGSYTPPTIEERLHIGLRHLKMLAEDIGEVSACLEMRKQFCAYSKTLPGQIGLHGIAGLRDKLVHAKTIAEYEELINHE
ncbi:MAG: tRNA-dihydrouridine synthase [Spirochaetaceae bacterium]|nr:tRNA-dihydrouridine synthase [Spirochaetaceae bacterium]